MQYVGQAGFELKDILITDTITLGTGAELIGMGHHHALLS